jgi:uncharacterized protein YodC (DUF2158 family)
MPPFLKCNLLVLAQFDPMSGARETEFSMSTFTKRASIAKALTLGIAFSMPLSIPAFSSTPSNTAAQSQTSPSFRPGDLVRLRSGGPAMTVDSIKGNQADCFWTGTDGEPNAESFPIEVLQKF